VFYQMLTGELPIGRFAPPSRKVHIDVRLDEVVLRALEKEPELRYQHASDIKTQVETIIMTPAGESTGAPKKSDTVRVLEILFGVTFTSPVAIRLVNISALGFLCFLGFVPLPGWQSFFGFSGFFGFIGLAFIVERFRNAIVVGRRGDKAVINWRGVLPVFVVSLAVAESVVALLSLAIVNRMTRYPSWQTFAAVLAINVADRQRQTTHHAAGQAEAVGRVASFSHSGHRRVLASCLLPATLIAYFAWVRRAMLRRGIPKLLNAVNSWLARDG